MKTLGTFVSLIGVIFLVGGSYASSDSTANPNVAPESRPKVYDSSADGSKQITEALVLGKRNHKHVLLQFGGNWCVPCLKLHKLFETNRTISETLQANYVVVHIEYNDRNDHLITKYRARELGLPFIVIIDAEGKHLITKNSEELEEGSGHSPEKVLAFLNEWTPSALRAKPLSQWVQEFLEKPEHTTPGYVTDLLELDARAEAVPYLMDMIKTRPAAMSSEGRIRAYKALAKIAPTSTVPFLAEQFVSDHDMRSHLGVILTELGRDAEEAVPALRYAFRSSDFDLQRRAACVLAHLDPDNPELVPTMVTWLGSSNVVARRTAPWVLGELGPAAESAIPALTEASADVDGTVRQNATKAIAKIRRE